MSEKPLRPEDYLDPACPLCEKPAGTAKKVQMIPQKRISQKLDELMGIKEYQQAEQLLKYWLQEARDNGDRQGEFMVLNEMMGYYRKVAEKEKGYEAIDRAIGMLDELGYRNSVSGATCYTNAATVCITFHDGERAMKLFEMAEEIYGRNIEGNEYKVAGLYNNMATALVEAGEHDRAEYCYEKALQLLENVEDSQLEAAVIYLNMLDEKISRFGEEYVDSDEAAILLEKAREQLDDERVVRDGYYAFVCEKCLSIYEFFGWQRYSDKLKERIAEFHERA